MKTLLAWIGNILLLLLAANAGWAAFDWLKSVHTTHAMADVVMFFFNLVTMVLLYNAAIENIKARLAK